MNHNIIRLLHKFAMFPSTCGHRWACRRSIGLDVPDLVNVPPIEFRLQRRAATVGGQTSTWRTDGGHTALGVRADMMLVELVAGVDA